MSDKPLVKGDTEPRAVYAWNVWSTDGDGVRCLYDKKTKILVVERSGSSSSCHVVTLAKARIQARELAEESFRMFGLRRQLIELQHLAVGLLR